MGRAVNFIIITKRVNRRQKTEDRGQKTEDRGQRTESGNRRAEIGGRRPVVRGQLSENQLPIADYRVKEVREYIRTITGFKSLRIVERETNLGLATSIISGVTEVVNQYGRIIVLEDDMVTSPFFLRYMNDALDLYENEEKVVSIHGYVYPIQGLQETFFIKGADCWGWATWKRGWDLFDADGEKLLNELKKAGLLKRFDFDGAYPYTKMLRDQIEGKNNSWAIRWYASALLHDKLTLYPGKSLVHNIGTDASGTHRDDCSNFTPRMSTTLPLLSSACSPKEDVEAYIKFANFLNSTRKSIIRRQLHDILMTKTKAIIPSWIKSLRRRYFCRYGFKGEYSSWDEALKASTSYAAAEILERARQSARLLRDGRIVAERDGAILESLPEWPPLGKILKEAEGKDDFTVLDYGGSLGTLYFQYQSELVQIGNLKWIVLEQKHFVKCGKEEFSDEHLQFVEEDEFIPEAKPDVLILSSVIQYLEKPYEKLAKLLALNIPLIIVDRTPFSRRDREILCIQRVDPKIYDASYPAWLLDRRKFIESFTRNNYEILFGFTPIDFDYRAEYKGFVFKLKTSQ